MSAGPKAFDNNANLFTRAFLVVLHLPSGVDVFVCTESLLLIVTIYI